MNKRIGLLLLSWLCAWSAFTQTVDAVILPPPQTAYIADFFSNPNLFRVIVTNKTPQPIDVKIGGKLVLDGTTLGATDVRKSDVFTLQPGVNFLNGEDVYKEFMRGNIAADTSNRSFQDAFYSGQWPSGLYEWCLEINHATTNLVLFNKCVPRFVTSYQPPILILPNEGQVLNNPGTVLFRWTPITPAYREGIVYYQVRVFDIKTGQTPMQAFQANLPIIEKKVPSQTVLVWPSEVPIESGQYIWTVRALDAQDRPISFPTQYAEPLTFTVNKGTGSNGRTGQLAFSAVYPKTESSVSTTELDGKFLRFQVDLSALGAASTEANNGLRIYMIEKKAGFYTKAALQQAILRDKLHYKSPLLNINAQINNVALSKILPDSLAGREFAWIIRAEVAGRTYESDLFTFEYKSPTSKPINKPKSKFDCECKDTLCAPPVIADRSGVSTWKVGDTLLLGRYELRLTEWSNGDGKGIIDLPYAKVGIQVGLAGIRANKAKQIFDGTATMADSDFPKDIKDFGTFRLNAETLASLNAHFVRMSGAMEEGLKMPFSFKEHLSTLKLKLPFDLVVTGMRFSPEESSLDLVVLIEHTPGQFVKFMAKNVPMAANGISFKDLKLYLAEDVVVNNLSLKTSADVTKGSYIQFDCDGIKTFHLNTRFAFDPQHVQTLSDQPLTTVVKFDAEKWGDFLATASLEAFRLTDVKGITFEAKDWTFDKSTARNPEGLKRPNQSETPMAWQGFFTEGGTVKVSKDLLPAAEKDLALTGKNIAWDSLGLSGQMIATEFSLATQGSDWNVGVDSFKVQIDKSKLSEMSFVGDLSLSYLFKDLKYKAVFKRDSQQRIAYHISPETDAEAKLWKTKFKLANTSQVSLLPTTAEGEETAWQLAANLDAEVSFNIANGDIDTGYISALRNMLGFSDFSLDIPTITIKGLKINHPDLPAGQKIGIQSVKADRPFKLGGLDIDLVGVDLEQDTMTVNSELRKAQVMVLHLSKDVDFDCKIWALRSTADTNRWDFSKLAFGLPVPKIECKKPDTIILDNNSSKPIAIGDKIQVGSFAMQIEKAATENALGKGVIRIPYLATNIAVEFNDQLKINDANVAFEGYALADVNAAILPTGAFDPLVNGYRRVNLGLMDKNQLAAHFSRVGKSATALPLSFKKMLRGFGSKLPFDVLVTDLRFVSAMPTMSLAMFVPVSNGIAQFEMPQLAFDQRGFSIGDIKMQLATNIDLGGGVRLLRGGDSYAQLNCNGFETFGLAGDYTLSSNLLTAVGKTTAPLITFKAKTKQFSDFIATAEIEPFSIKAITGSELSVTNAIFDRSGIENSEILAFPKPYKGNKEATWKGIYVQDFTMKMPSILPNQEDKTLTFSGKGLILDSTGVTTTIKTSNITSIGSNAFGMNIKDLTVDIVQNTIDNALLSGNVQLPLFSEAIDFEGTYAKDSTGITTYALKTSNEANFNFWRANLKINKGSGLELVKNSSDKWERRASIDLEAKLDVNTQMLEEYVSADILRGLKTALGVDLLDFEIPTFKFKGLKINHPQAKGGRQYALDAYETTGPIKIAGQEVKLTDLDIVEDTVSVKGKSYKKGVGLVFSFFKGTDFELSTWAVPSEADTNKWTFGKWDLKFAIPKFECAPVAPVTVDNSGSQPLELNKTVQIGSFSMTIDQTANGTQLGVGRIRVPYFGSTLKVNFDEKLRVNAQNQAFGGVVWSLVNPAILPTTSLLTEATTGLRNVKIGGLDVNALSQIASGNSPIGISLPLSLKQSMGKFSRDLPFDVLVTHINFLGTAPYMSLAMLVPTPSGDLARFEVPKLPLSNKGFDMSNLQVRLADEMALGKGFYLSGAETTTPTFATLNCGGLSGFQLNGYYELDRDLFSSVNGTGTPKARFTAKAEGLGQFIATAAVEPLRINALNGSELTITNAILDRSNTENSSSAKFPKAYKGNKDASWQGMFVGDFTLKMPSFLPNQADKKLNLSGKNMVFDSTGATALIEATNVLAASSNTEGGWGLSVDTLNMTMVASKVDSAYVSGKIELPFFSQNIPYNGVFQYNKTVPYYNLSTSADATIDFWRTSIGVTQGSNVEVYKNGENKWERRAKLNLEAKMDVNTQALSEYVDASVLNVIKDALGVNLLDFELPKIKFNGFKINYPNLPAGKTFALDSISYTGSLRLGGQEIKLTTVELVQDSVTIKGKSFSKGVGLVFKLFKGVDFDLSIWSVPSSTDSTKWTFGKYDLNFGLPKFECVEPKPFVVEKSSPRIPKVGEMVNLAGFSMKIDQLASAAQMGIGRIRIPYLGTTIKVNFGETLSLNAEGKVNAGVAFSQINNALFPNNAITTLANARQVALSQLNENALDQIIANNTPDGIKLPLSLRKSMGGFGSKLPFDVLVTNINFEGISPNMSLAALVPDRSGKLVKFSVPSLGINSKGFNFSDLKFQLGQNYELSPGLFLNGSELATARKTSLNFNCDGFVSMDLDGYYQLNPQQFTLIGKTDAPKLTFKATATSMSNFMAQATAEPMQIVGLDKSELRLTKLVYDRSTTENEPTMRFPERYKGKTDATWNGIYVQEATLKLPSFLPNDNQTLTFSGKNLLVDSTGASGTFDAANVLKAGTSEWGLAVDTVRLTMLQSKLDSAALMGTLNVPLFAQPVKYRGRYKQDSTNTNLRVGTTEDASLKFFGASITLLKGAEVELDKTPTQWERRAKMDVDAEFKINKDSLTKYGGVVASLDKLMKDMGLPNLDFEFPKIKLRGLKVNHKSLPMGKNYGVEGIDKSGDLKIAGQTVAIRSIDLIESAKSMVIQGKTYAKSLGLVFQLNKVVDAELAIYMVPDPKDANKWTFGKFELSNAIPKFECVAVTPATAPTGSVKALAVNQEVTVGDFKMKVTKLPAGTATGEGEVRIPYMGTTVKVKFDNGFKVNTEGKAFGGIVTSDLNTTGFFPTGSFTNNATIGNVIDVAKMKLDNLTSLAATDIPIQMPMSLQQRLGRLGNQLPFDLLVTNINLSSAKQSMSMAMLVPNVMGTTVRFATDDLMLNGKGFGLSSLQLGLASDLKLADGVFLNGGNNNLRTRAIFNCDGMESFSLAGRYEFPNTNFVKPLTGTGIAKLEFSGTSSNLTNFIVEATASPLELSFLAGSDLRLSRLSYDRSATANAAGIKFPPQYGATVPTSWRGFYAEEASLAVPSLLPNQSGKLKFAGKNILLDSMGLSGQFQVQDLFSTKVDNLWSLKFDTLGINVVQGKLGDIQVAGEIGFPVLGVSSRFDGKGVQTILGKDTTYKYTLAPRGDLSMDAWRVKFNLLKSSKIDLVREQKAGKVTNKIDAQLDAELSVDLNTDFIKNNADPALVDLLKNKLGVNVLDFSFPKFKLEGFKLSPLASQKVSFGKITPVGDLTLAGVKIDLVSTAVETAEIVTKAGRKAATGFVMTMRKSGVNFKFRVWAVPSSADTTKWDFGKLDLVLDLPKFSCTNTSVAFTDKSAGTLAAGKKVKVAGGFDLEITQLASGATPGKGKITVPHFGTTYEVAFGTDLKVNSKNEVIEGDVLTLPNQDIFPKDAIVKRTTGVLDLDLQKLQITEALTSKLQSLNSVTKFPISMSSALLKMSEMLDVPALDIPLDITLTGIYFTPQGAMLGGFTAVGTDGKYLRMGVGGLTIHQNGITFDKLKLFLVDNL